MKSVNRNRMLIVSRNCYLSDFPMQTSNHLKLENCSGTKLTREMDDYFDEQLRLRREEHRRIIREALFLVLTDHFDVHRSQEESYTELSRGTIFIMNL